MPDMKYFSTRGGKETLSFEEVSCGIRDDARMRDEMETDILTDVYRPC